MSRYLWMILTLLLSGCTPPILTRDQQAELARIDQLEQRTRALYASSPPDFRSINDMLERKAAFLEYLRPAVAAENARIDADRIKLASIMSGSAAGKPLTEEQLRWLSGLQNRYKVDDTDDRSLLLQQLSMRVDKLPVALVLIQAANESAWGTSRFATEGNNYFGQWCHQPGCGLIPANRAVDATHEVTRFATVYDSVSAYFVNINTHPAYQPLRDIRRQLRQREEPATAVALARGLVNYSELGEGYIEAITGMLGQNQALLGN